MNRSIKLSFLVVLFLITLFVFAQAEKPAEITPQKVIEQLQPALPNIMLPPPIKKLIEKPVEKPAPIKLRYHYTSSGDTFNKLSEKYYGSIDYAGALRDYNNSKAGLNRSLSNQVIKIPPLSELGVKEAPVPEAAPVAPVAPPVTLPLPPPPSQPEVIQATPEVQILPPAQPEIPSGGPPQRIFHFISSSDTLMGLSLKYYGTTKYYLKLARANNIKPPYNLSAGKYLLIPTEEELNGMEEE